MYTLVVMVRGDLFFLRKAWMKGKEDKFVKVVDLMSLSYSFKERKREKYKERARMLVQSAKNTGQAYWESYSSPSFPCVKALSMFIVQETAVTRDENVVDTRGWRGIIHEAWK